MPAWWGKKSTKSKDPQNNSQNSSGSNNNKATSIKNDKRRVGRTKDQGSNNSPSSKDNRPRSFDEVSGIDFARTSPRKSPDFGGGSSGFSGFDSSSSLDRVYPLPRPSVSSNDQSHGGGVGGVVGLGLGLGSASLSGSSVSSSASSDDHSNLDHGQMGFFRGQGDGKLSQLPSPGPASRGGTTTTSPLHPRLSGLSLDSPTGRLEDGRGECHRLPLPPGSPTSPSALPMPRTSGVTECSSNNLSKWKKGRLLGRGTFGHVYVGFNSENGQMCAIKEVRVVADDQSSKECLKQLNQEIMLLSQLSHPNIVQYIGSELGEETLSVYLEYVSGGSIHKLLQEYGPFREPVIQNYVRQILSGLAYLHGRNTVHRDIKGANILVDPNGDVKLADFGMAKHITSASSMLSFKGSPYWMAPEVVMNINGYSLAVDIWSLGCTVLEMATLKPPWSQYEGVAAIFKIGNSKDMPEIPDHLSNDAKSFIRSCLQREPSQRPTAVQLLEHPFVRDQAIPRVANVNITKQAFPQAFDGSRTPTALELRGSRSNISPEDYTSRQVLTVSRVNISPRENARTITSLPVSPCSSPLRQHGGSHRSFLSPTHPSYAFAGQSTYTSNDYSMFPMRPNSRNILEPWNEAPQFRAQTPGRTIRTRPIL
ncbi:mitogen-activated protein kinase kinase kinase 3-like [Coffea arabica]|uniref:mitogen-activated protein kinase kinase kinase n=1 Tax=Coffea arabica TaxID=13443 RepID=A0A6P6TKE3_COFAR|nr:mitogen-activated protein kinase kinase kinase 3-like isoform X1 [Coffea arabica]